ncbi:DUF333 domain-containing protein [Vibrio sp. SCSIO 43136]|uniref:DUF333 domain-containing protein n=1 Tax=Vibrio sp. SCSIO 43136 TaxID=2819101 RepID=UPI002075AE2E|nr:DUF333 domain-containing protein [Vibrio sp. SCSIO 43136]USD67263.1 DUF333 domain-containing protein [Vibrio sp. SCSIO 43136]
MKKTTLTASFCAIALISTIAAAHQGLAPGANPASQFCVNKGGYLKAAGDDIVCVMPSGKEIEQWELLRAENKQ